MYGLRFNEKVEIIVGNERRHFAWIEPKEVAMLESCVKFSC